MFIIRWSSLCSVHHLIELINDKKHLTAVNPLLEESEDREDQNADCCRRLLDKGIWSVIALTCLCVCAHARTLLLKECTSFKLVGKFVRELLLFFFIIIIWHMY